VFFLSPDPHGNATTIPIHLADGFAANFEGGPQRMNAETQVWLAVAILFLVIGFAAVFWPGETSQTGKMSNGSGVSIKRQNVRSYETHGNEVWKPNAWLPGVGKINGHGVDYTFKVWKWGLFFGALIVAIAVALLPRVLP
jgi:hypothetical protein